MAQVARNQPQGLVRVSRQYRKNLSLLYLGGQGEVVGASLLQSVVQAGTKAANPGGVGLVNGLRRYQAVPAMQPTGSITIAATLSLNTSSGSTERILIGQDGQNAPYSGYDFQRTAAGAITFGVGDASSTITEITEPSPVLGVHTYVCTFDGKTLSMYRDGALIVSGSRTSGISYPANAIPFIGAYFDGAQPQGFKLSGGINMLALWANRALTAGEVRNWQLFDVPSQTQFPNPSVLAQVFAAFRNFLHF